MNCFYHQQVIAVGVCSSCGRGLCSECCTVVGKRLACRESCEGDVECFNKLREFAERAPERAKQQIREGKRVVIAVCIFLLIFGGIPLVLSLINGRDATFWAMAYACIVLLSIGAITWSQKSARQADDTVSRD